MKGRHFFAIMAFAAMSASAQSASDRLDIVAPDGGVRSVFVSDLESVKFPSILGRHNLMNLTLTDGSVRRINADDFLRVDFTPADPSALFPVTAVTDWNARMDLNASQGHLGQVIEVTVGRGVPSSTRVYGDLSGKDYTSLPGFLSPSSSDESSDTYRFTMPFEPVTVRCREYYPVLYNGVRMPEVWPPVSESHTSHKPMDVPWLRDIPSRLPVDVGRQLFVDDFLIESTDLVRVFHKPVKYEGNPVLSPVPSDMTAKTPGATAKDGGVWWEPRENRFKMWYEAGWYGKMALAVSDDGLHWTRPDVADGSNIIPSLADIRCNSSAVVLDYDAPDAERYKLFMRSPNSTAKDLRGWSMVSPDGISWTRRTATGPCGDKSTMFYNPFRRRWVYSIRSPYLESEPHGRARYYHEHPDFIAGAQWEEGEPVFWCQSDELDAPDPEFRREPQLYNVNAVAYESLMLGMMQILIDENDVAQREERPKYTMLEPAFSRDGFHWHRPCRDYFIESTRREGTWDRGYVQSVGGICAVTGDKLLIYYIGFAGGGENKTASNGATGLAILRRDGFASMDAPADRPGTLLTRPLTSQSGRYLFINASCAGSSLRAELLDAAGNPIPGFTADECLPLTADSTIAPLSWSSSGSGVAQSQRGGSHASAGGFAGSSASAGGFVGALSEAQASSAQSGEAQTLSELPASLLAEGVRIRFILGPGASLYSFWLSPSPNGESLGYVGAGGPGFTSNIDTRGLLAYPSPR